MRAIVGLIAVASVGAWSPAPVDVFISDGPGGIPQYRIPALVVTGSGALLAISEKRYHPGTDCGYKELVARRSTDGGVSWTAEDQVIAGLNPLNNTSTGNPMAVWHAPSGRVVITFSIQQLPSGLCSPSDGVFVVDDGGSDGVSWGAPRNITGMLGDTAGHVVPGPGAGSVLTVGDYAGRIIMSGTKGPYGVDAVFYSDDAGKTWAPSNSSLPKMDESGVVELPDGRVVINMRTDHLNSSCQCRAFAVSNDGGTSFGPIGFDPTLIEPVCEGSILRVGSSVFFANPASTSSRSNITVRRGTGLPGGWQPSVLSILPGDAWGGYTSMAGPLAPPASGGGSMGGILFEHAPSNTAAISFTAFPLDF